MLDTLKSGGSVFSAIGAGTKGFVGSLSTLVKTLGLVGIGLGAAFTVWKVYDNYIQKQVEDARNAGTAWKESSDSLETYRARVSELRVQLASGTLTEEEAYNAKSELLSIQQSLTDSYGEQAGGIDLVNGSLREQLALMNELSQSDANKYLNENEKGIEKATKEMEKRRKFYLGEYYDVSDTEGVNDLKNAIKSVNEKYGDVLSSETGHDGSIQLYFEGDATQAEEALNDFMTQVRTASEDLGGNSLLDYVFGNAGSGVEKSKKIIEDYKDVYDKANAAKLAGDSKGYIGENGVTQTASEWLRDYTKAVEDYNNALASGDSSKIEQAKTNFDEVDKSVKSLLGSGMKDYADSFNKVGDNLNTAAIHAKEFKDAITGVDTSDSAKNIAKVASGLKELNLSDLDLKYAVQTDGIQAGEAHINNLIKAAIEAGFISDESSESVNKLISMLVELGIVSSKTADGIDSTKNSVENLQSSLAKYAETQEKVRSAMSNSKSATGLTEEDIKNVTDAYKDLESFNPYRLFEETAHGVHLNTEELERLNEEASSNKLKEFTQTIEDIRNKISEKRKKGEDTSALEAELRNAQLLKSELEGATSAYNKFIQATNSSKERDSYEGIGGAYEGMKETLEQGWYGDESLNAYLDLLLSAEKRTGDARKDFAQLDKTIAGTSHSLLDYWKYDKDGKLVTDGLFDFMDDVNKKLGDSFAKKNKDGLYEFDFDGDKLKKVADEFGTTTEVVELFERALIDAGMAVDLSDVDFTGQVDKAISALKDLQKSGDFSESINLDFDIDKAPIEDLKSHIDTLKKERVEIDAETNPEAAAALDELISKCEQTYYARIDAETNGSLAEAAAIVTRLKELTASPLTVEARAANTQEIVNLATQLSLLPESVQIAVGIEPGSVGNVNAIVNQLNTNPKSINVPVNYEKGTEPETVNDAKGKANFELGTSPDTVPDAKGKANYTLGYYPTSLPTLRQRIIADKIGFASGTAHADGTVMHMWDKYRSSIGAYAIGRNWSLPHDESALVNELGTESIVRDGRWFPIRGGAHIAQLKKGDIIFSAKQTEELIKTGRVVSGGGHGRVALADGTAYSMLNAYDKGSGGGRRPGSGSSSSLSNKYNKPSKKTSSKKKSSNSKANKEAKEFEETIDLIEIAINRATEAINRLKIVAESVFNTLSTRNNAIGNEISKITQKIDLHSKAYDGYMRKASSVGLSESWAKKIRDGSIEIATIKDEELAKKIKEYKEYYEKAINVKDEIAQMNQDIAKLYQEKFNNISGDFENQLELLEHMTNSYDQGIEDLEERGYLASTNFYKAMQKIEQQNIAIQKKELESLVQAMSDAVHSGKIKEGSDAWYEMQASINGVKESIQESETEIIKLQNSIREIEWDRFDYLQDRISSITDEADFMIELMENSKLFTDTGKFTDTGNASLGLHGQNYNVYMAQADKYAEEIKKLNAEIANDPNNTKLLERREELLEAQRDSILAAEDEKLAIRDLVEEGIKIELDHLENLIDKYLDALDTAKDLYDYQKRVEEQTSDIVKIQKQLSAYSGDSSEEAKATIQKLQVELKDAQKNLEETQYDRFIDEQKSLLDHLYSEYELILNSRLDNLDALIAEMIEHINTNSSSINDTLIAQSDKVGYDLSEAMKSIWSNEGGAGSIITKYGDSFTSLLTSVNNVLNGISLKITEMTQKSDEAADKVVEETKPTTKPNPKPTAPAKPSQPSKPTTPSKPKGRTETDYYGVALAISNGGYGWGDGKTREKRLKEKGFDPARIRTLVNKMYKDGYIHSGKWVGKYKGIRSLSPYHYNKYKHGGLIDYTGIAQVDGTPNNPEVVLDAKDSKNFMALRDVMKGISDGTNPLSKLFDDDSAAKIVQKLSDINAPKTMNQSNIGDIIYQVSIPIEHVQDYNDFMNQMKKDGKFEKMIRSMTVDRLAGGSSLSKNKYNW